VLGDIIQPTHLLFILVVALLVLGPKRLPEVGRSLGRGLRDFREAVTHTSSEARELIYGEDSLGGSATPAESPIAERTSTDPGVSTTATPAAGAATERATPGETEPTKPLATDVVAAPGPDAAVSCTSPPAGSSAAEPREREPVYSD
jgi:sec-independent protein translocase protein TatA